jgi:hypothetical protein
MKKNILKRNITIASISEEITVICQRVFTKMNGEKSKFKIIIHVKPKLIS